MINIKKKADFDNLKNLNHPQALSVEPEEGVTFFGFTTTSGDVWVQFEPDTLYKVVSWEQVLPECDQIDEYMDVSDLEVIIPMLIKG